MTSARELAAGLGTTGPTAWHRLDPLTRSVVAVGSMVSALLVNDTGALVGLALLAVVVPAIVARVLGRVVRLALLLALPLAISVALVNVLFTPGGATLVAQLGPIRVTREGLEVAALVVARVFSLAGAAALFYLTTSPAALVASLQHHGVPARLTFLVHSSVALVPALVERAAEVTAAQRARGLDTEGSLRRRARGLLAVAAPTALGAIDEVETRTLALETRSFSRPGPRALLWAPHDSTVQRVARWSIALALVVLGAARIAGI